jgi:hypothetical protein
LKLNRLESAANTGKFMATLLILFLSLITFVVAFYSTTIVMNYLYSMDSALLLFDASAPNCKSRPKRFERFELFERIEHLLCHYRGGSAPASANFL